MKISVLIPFYNVEKFFEQNIRSLFSNKYATKVEFIFVNDCSTDNSLLVLTNVIREFQHLKSNIKIINNEKNLGICKTRNVLINNALGEYILFVDSDDWVEPDYLDEFYNSVQDSDPDIVFCDYYSEKNNKSIRYKQIVSDLPSSNLEHLLKDEIPGYLWVKLIKKNIITTNNITFENFDILEDFLFSLRILIFSKSFKYINKPLYHYRIQENSILHKDYKSVFNPMFNALAEVSNILINHNLYSKYINALIYRKLNIKKKFLTYNEVPLKLMKYVYTTEDIEFIKNNTFKIYKKQKLYYYAIKSKNYLLLKVLLLSKGLSKEIKSKGYIKDKEELSFLTK